MPVSRKSRIKSEKEEGRDKGVDLSALPGRGDLPTPLKREGSFYLRS
jgi:hypothetical protein